MTRNINDKIEKGIASVEDHINIHRTTSAGTTPASEIPNTINEENCTRARTKI